MRIDLSFSVMLIALIFSPLIRSIIYFLFFLLVSYAKDFQSKTNLEIAVAVVGAGGVDAMLVRDDLPELGADLVAALASLQVDNLAHVDLLGTAREQRSKKKKKEREEKTHCCV